MDTLVSAIIYITAIGFVCATLLAICAKVMYVKVDEREQVMRGVMPGANCGACGFPGCNSYAAALLEGDVATNLCPPGGPDLVKRIGEVLGTDGGEEIVEKAAVVHCCADEDACRVKMDYIGMSTCVAAHQLFGGQTACTFGCLGFGDCMKVCPTGAVCIEKGLARIDTRKCNGCGLCVKACPSHVITVDDATIAVAILCKNTEKGGALKDKCTKGCIGCMKCVKACPSQAITVTDSLASIDYSKCDGCGKCIESCVKGCIVAR